MRKRKSGINWWVLIINVTTKSQKKLRKALASKIILSFTNHFLILETNGKNAMAIAIRILNLSLQILKFAAWANLEIQNCLAILVDKNTTLVKNFISIDSKKKRQVGKNLNKTFVDKNSTAISNNGNQSHEEHNSQ